MGGCLLCSIQRECGNVMEIQRERMGEREGERGRERERERKGERARERGSERESVAVTRVWRKKVHNRTA